MIRRFRGESVHKVDQKGRVSVPAPFRRVLEEGDPDWTPGQAPNLVLVYGGKESQCIEGFSIAGIQTIDEKISRMPTFSAARRALERWLNTQSTYAQLDDTGRIVIPPKLRTMFGIDAEATFAGMGDKFQIWTPEAFAADMSALNDWRETLSETEDPFAMLDAIDLGGGS